jgi:AbrB family looped-hinge helix DNA binding protein
METTVDRAGRVVIPKRMRDRLGLGAGVAITIDDVGDHLEIRPTGASARLVERGGRMVFTAEVPVRALTDRQVRELLEDERR